MVVLGSYYCYCQLIQLLPVNATALPLAPCHILLLLLIYYCYYLYIITAISLLFTVCIAIYLLLCNCYTLLPYTATTVYCFLYCLFIVIFPFIYCLPYITAISSYLLYFQLLTVLENGGNGGSTWKRPRTDSQNISTSNFTFRGQSPYSYLQHFDSYL